MKELLIYIAQSLVDNPDQVTVTETETDNAVVFQLTVGEGDMGKVIGKQGKIAKAIRTIMKTAAIKTNIKVTVEII
ncbi:MAG: KH domain-containing protein [Eubacteriales bacterium]|nr:KH domain-containing protein [Eubacteriales bacterium]